MTRITGIYGRQSMGDDIAIDDQVEDCTDDAGEQGWTIYDVYRDRESASEHNRYHKRPDWSRLRTDIKNDKINAIVVWELSRCDRRMTPWSAFIDLCKDKGVLIRVTRIRRTYNPADAHDRSELRRGGISSAEESDLRSDRAIRGTAKAARRGRPPAGPTPIGYRKKRDPNTGKLDNWEPDPERVPVAVAIFEGIAAFRTIRELSRKYDVDVSVLRRMIRNVAYKGVRKHKAQADGVTRYQPGTWPAIIDDDLWERANAVLDNNAKSHRPSKVRMLLTGAVKCGVCGGLVGGDSVTRRGMLGPRYGCRENGCVWFHGRDAEEYIQQRLFETLADPDYHHKIKVAHQAGSEAATRIKDQIKEQEQYLSELKEAARKRREAALDLADIITGVRADISKLTGELERLSVPESVYSIMMDLQPGEHLADWSEGMSPTMQLVMERYDKLPMHARRALILDVLDCTAHKAKHRGVRFPIDTRLTVVPRYGPEPAREPA